jgi:hypothetical protein
VAWDMQGRSGDVMCFGNSPLRGVHYGFMGMPLAAGLETTDRRAEEFAPHVSSGQGRGAALLFFFLFSVFI